jgi:hypothetical protein
VAYPAREGQCVSLFFITVMKYLRQANFIKKRVILSSWFWKLKGKQYNTTFVEGFMVEARSICESNRTYCQTGIKRSCSPIIPSKSMPLIELRTSL